MFRFGENTEASVPSISPPDRCRGVARRRRRRRSTSWRRRTARARLLRAVHERSQAFALAVPHAEALRVRDDVAFFQAVRASLVKRAPGEARPQEELDLAVRQIFSHAGRRAPRLRASSAVASNRRQSARNVGAGPNGRPGRRRGVVLSMCASTGIISAWPPDRHPSISAQ